ncbi:hypothetical protein EDB81DRAFT_766031 [Dactylonectria macrodidyma]|uniref:Uncharacterized protein n=1 Tax=Dactylonectria macrodidyma TaxID=307937 RepID=A0A9P9DPT7_9HYPO|nr:hypothetical protein EDB81DRAFT_766031 [Dactylonectria macrodidyma]
MDPLTGLRMTYYLVLFGIDVAQVPSTVRHSLELVRTCYQDAQHLIELRTTYLSLLEKRPIVLERVNSIIAAATAGLAEVCAIVEKCRPEAHNGKTGFRNRLEWIFVDEKEFRAQETMISRHHASVLAEMNFLRQIALLAPVVDEKSDGGEKKKETRLFDNVALFGDLLGGTSSGNPPGLSAQMDSLSINPSVDATRDVRPQSTVHPPPPYSLRSCAPANPSITTSAHPANQPTTTQPSIAFKAPSHSRNTSFSSHDLRGLSLMFGDRTDPTVSGMAPASSAAIDLYAPPPSSADIQTAHNNFVRPHIQHANSEPPMANTEPTHGMHSYTSHVQPEPSWQNPADVGRQYRASSTPTIWQQHAETAGQGQPQSIRLDNTGPRWTQNEPGRSSSGGNQAPNDYLQPQLNQLGFFPGSSSVSVPTQITLSHTPTPSSMGMANHTPSPFPGQRPSWAQVSVPAPHSIYNEANLSPATASPTPQPQGNNAGMPAYMVSPPTVCGDLTPISYVNSSRSITPRPFQESEPCFSTIPPEMIYKQGARNIIPSPSGQYNTQHNTTSNSAHYLPQRKPAPTQLQQPVYGGVGVPPIQYKAWAPPSTSEASFSGGSFNIQELPGDTVQVQHSKPNSHLGANINLAYSMNMQPQELPAYHLPPDPAELPGGPLDAGVNNRPRY